MITDLGTSTMTTNSIERLLVGQQYEQHLLNFPAKPVPSWLQNDSHRIEDFFSPLLRERHQIQTERIQLEQEDTESFRASSHRPREIFRTLIHSLMTHRSESLVQQALGLSDR